MRYTKFGDTGVNISKLGFGCMRFPMIKINDKDVVDEDKTIEMIKRAYELGVNYYDTAYFYCNNLGENALGRALKGIRDKIYLSSKSPSHLIKKEGDYRRMLEEQLRKLDVEVIDFYHFHGIGYQSFIEIDKKSNWLDEAIKAKQEGLIKHISFSFHDKPEEMKKLIDLNVFESVLCQYNVIDRSCEDSIRYAKEKGLGVVVMSPVGGGRVSGLPKNVAHKLGLKVNSNAELALRFVFANDNIHCALSGMGDINMVEENATTASNAETLSKDEVDAINKMMKENEKLSKLYCTGCGYCMPCPKGVNIPHIFKMMNYYRVYGIIDYSKDEYAKIGTNPWIEGKRADACNQCGACETKCPQKIQIRKQLKDCHEALG
ncbi:aldo/keto reductase [Herbivorax sp. ANBcel31]|uniref:aldo/keto reductase n=1 Tax=Herbivorax sp. ANBcel31 TaxID=3069754 RepID=UPI0027B7B006|nr:aldo/keto reductase [Herbivorax sp. ANBcel31]MDQ2087218.1 aldo/keto reductase [Herbivorax sp. ANBcel31]